MRLPTIKIKADTKLGYMIINEGDFKEGVHRVFVEAAQESISRPEQSEPEEIESEDEGQQSESGETEPENARQSRRGRPPKTDKG